MLHFVLESQRGSLLLICWPAAALSQSLIGPYLFFALLTLVRVLKLFDSFKSAVSACQASYVHHIIIIIIDVVSHKYNYEIAKRCLLSQPQSHQKRRKEDERIRDLLERQWQLRQVQH